ncbi:MAG: pilus assembly PilX N-terminal domain-containing protein [Clostridium sp.]
MRNKKREGSALVSILAITIILLTLGSVIVTSVMGTTKTTASSNEIKDLQYAAESGIEIARSYFTGPEGKDGVIDTINNQNDKVLVKALEKGVVGNVELTSSYGKKDDGTEDKSRIIVKSEAFHRDSNEKSEVVSINLRRAKGEKELSIFDHGLIAGQGDLTIENGGSNNINSTISAGGLVKPSNLVVQGDNEKKENNPFAGIIFNEKEKLKKVVLKDNIDGYPFVDYYRIFEKEEDKLEKAEVLEITMADFTKNEFNLINGEIPENAREIIDLKDKELENVIKVNVINPTNSVLPLTLLFVNAEELEIDMVQPLVLNNVMIITNSDIKIKGNTSLKINNSTMLGNSIYASFETAFFVNEESGNPNPNGEPDIKGNGILYKNRERVLEIIECFVSGISGGSSSSGGEFIPEEENPYS